ncbi:uncharacterized protein TRIREDRAFT_107076 [Trichoderma reesei QM6a]|uniref:Predicted protein n=2 Tax=Hypocrea jecorina TaxID=51453 RepID=G0RIB3_HYPJQ|nr:uncharacterized protein TRIREDRAFT_107076 [Trichoderma reesei QM6a]EGR49000.1 predicted protein [Trichoderma reesei QM6a]ETS02374.1 hypothetical protein M419DRAFT_77970 [Trichoderma reesei RUT C-30]
MISPIEVEAAEMSAYLSTIALNNVHVRTLRVRNNFHPHWSTKIRKNSAEIGATYGALSRASPQPHVDVGCFRLGDRSSLNPSRSFWRERGWYRVAPVSLTGSLLPSHVIQSHTNSIRLNFFSSFI